MKNENSMKKIPESGLRLAARITGSVWVGVSLFFNIGYMIEGYQRNGNHFILPETLDILVWVFFHLGLLGLVIAFWKTIQGVILSSVGFLGATLFLLLNPKLNFNGIALFILLIPTLLYFAYWRASRKKA